MGFSENLKEFLNIKGWKQADLCRMTGIQTSLMSEYLKNKKSPTIKNAIKIADSLCVSVDDLVQEKEGNEEMNNKIIGERLKAKRKELGYTLNDLAQELGFNKSTILRYESGDISNLKLPIIEAIAHILQVNPAWLLGKSEDEQPIVKHSSINPLNEEEQQLIDNYRQLNEEGQERLLETSEEFLELTKYKKYYECEMAQ